LRHSGANSADVAASADALRKFFVTLSAISHNPLLAAVCKAITEIQVGIAVELSGGRSGDFGRVSGALFDARCLVQLKIAIDTWLLLRFAIYVWTIPARFVQIYLAISVPRATRLDVTP
jgi:hypothetical protein